MKPMKKAKPAVMKVAKMAEKVGVKPAMKAKKPMLAKKMAAMLKKY